MWLDPVIICVGLKLNDESQYTLAVFMCVCR